MQITNYFLKKVHWQFVKKISHLVEKELMNFPGVTLVLQKEIKLELLLKLGRVSGRRLPTETRTVWENTGED